MSRELSPRDPRKGPPKAGDSVGLAYYEAYLGGLRQALEIARQSREPFTRRQLRRYPSLAFYEARRSVVQALQEELDRREKALTDRHQADIEGRMG